MSESKDEYLQLILLLAIVFTVFLIPLVKSTYFFGYDPFFYQMMTTEIIKTADISTEYNHPPLYPTLFASLSISTGVSPFYLIRYSLPFVVVFLGVSMYLFARELTNDHKIALLSVVFICLSSGYNFHWFYQFHVNYLEHRPAYLSWTFNLLFFYSLSKYLKKELNFIIPGIFLGASLFTYFLSSGLASLTFGLFGIIFLINSKDTSKTIKTFLPVFLTTFLIFAPFFFFNLKNIREIIEIERNAILKAREPLDYFVFHGFPAGLAIIGIVYSLFKRKCPIVLAWIFILLLYSEGYWLHKVYDPIIKLVPLSELVIRDLKVPTAFFASVGLMFILEKARRIKYLPTLLLIIILLTSSGPAFYGIIKTEPFTYTDKIPLSAFQYLEKLPDGVIVSDELTCMMGYDFAGKDVIVGMYPRAGDFSVRKSDQEHIQHQLEDQKTVSQRAEELIEKYDVKYFILNFGIWGRIIREIEYNEGWDKILDSDQASLFILRKLS